MLLLEHGIQSGPYQVARDVPAFSRFGQGGGRVGATVVAPLLAVEEEAVVEIDCSALRLGKDANPETSPIAEHLFHFAGPDVPQMFIGELIFYHASMPPALCSSIGLADRCPDQRYGLRYGCTLATDETL